MNHSFEISWSKYEFYWNKILDMKRKFEISMCQQRVDKVIVIV